MIKKGDFIDNSKRVSTSIYHYYNDSNHLQWIENVVGVSANYHIQTLIENDMRKKARTRDTLVNYLCIQRYTYNPRAAIGRTGEKKTLYLTKLHNDYLLNVCFEQKTTRSNYISNLIHEDTTYRKGDEYTRDFYRYLI